MTNGKPIDQTFRGDPEGLLPEEEKVDEVVSVEDHAVWITGLTKAQYDGLVEALSPTGKPLGRTTRFVLRFCFTALLAAGCLWLIAALVTNLPTR